MTSGRLHIKTPLIAESLMDKGLLEGTEVEVNELLARDLEDLAVERSMLRALAHSRSVREILIVNGRALAGENPGTRIYREA